MGKSRAPTPPSPSQTAAAQTQSNIQTAVANSQLNNVNQITPYGNVTYSQTPGIGGIPNWTQTTTESPNQQNLRELDEQQGIALGNLGLEQTGRVEDLLSTPYDPRRFDTNAATGGALDVEGALGDYGGDVEARMRELATRGLSQEFDRSEEGLRSRLANQGVNAGTDAFKHEMEAFQEGKGQAFANAEWDARNLARDDRSTQLAELLTQRGTNLGEAQQQYGYDVTADQAARSNPLNEIIALMSGVQTSPIVPGQPNSYGINPTDIAGITNAGYQGQLGAWQQNQQTASANTGAAAGIASAAIIAM